MFDDADKYEYHDVEFDVGDYLTRIHCSAPEQQGILILPDENWRQSGTNAFMPETFNFAKWARRTNVPSSAISVVQVDEPKVAHLRSDEFWLPLVYLFSDASLQVYLNLVASYIYDRIRGALSGDKHRVHVRVFAEDAKRGKVREFSYDGDYEGLLAVMKKIDVNELMEK